jgi:hypothetical protein
MLLSKIFGLKSHQVDDMQAFFKAELSDPIYVCLPKGWYIDNQGNIHQHSDPKFNDTQHFIQLHCNLYGCKQAAHNWYQQLT